MLSPPGDVSQPPAAPRPSVVPAVQSESLKNVSSISWRNISR